MQQESSYELLISRVDAFTRKYYANQLLRGGLIFAACFLAYILLVSVGEYFLYFPAWVKIMIVLVLLLAGSLSLVLLIIIPLLKMRRLGKIISHEQAAAIIGSHFPEVGDKLLNILQLRHHAGTAESRELIEAGINQKAAQISVVPFLKAVDLGKNKKYLPYVLPPLLVTLFILVASPGLFKDASSRLMQPTRDFAPPAPFIFKIMNKDMRAALYESYTLKINVTGKELPERVFVIAGSEELEMQREGRTDFSYTFQRIAGDLDFRLTAGGYSSGKYTISVIEKPRLEAFRVTVTYPSYTGRKNEQLQSLSDMSVPEGTVFSWDITARHTDNIDLRFGNGPGVTPMEQKGDRFTAAARFLKDTSYTFTIANRQIPKADSFTYRVQVIADLHPQVQVEERKDSISGQQILLTGTASDDYGINRLYFHYSITDKDRKPVSEKNIPLRVASGTVSPVQHYFDLASLNLLPGQQVSYYIEAWDNDAVHGSKSARSAVFTYSMPDRQGIDSAINQASEQISKGLSNSADQAKKLRDEMKNMQQQLLQSDGMNWEKQQNMKSLLDKQMQLKSQVESIKKRFEQQQKQSEQKNYSEDIKEQQEAVKKQLDNLLNKELADQLKKLQEMMQQMNKDNAFQNLQQMEQQNKLFNMDLARIQELMKKLELQMKMEDMANKLEELAAREGDLNNKTEKQADNNAELGKEQKNIQNDLKKLLRDDMKQLEQVNEQQERPQKLGDEKELGKQADENMQQSVQQLQQSQQSKASQSQQKAQQNLQQMAAAMKQKAAGMDMQQIDIDIKAVRQILTNLIRFSFDQEQLMKRVKQTAASSPGYVSNTQEQHRLAGNARMIKDSLFVLSKRLFQMGATVNKETSDLESNIKLTTASLENRRISEAVTRQQYAMTSANNLALLLNEMLANLMQMQAEAMAMQQPGSGNCSKPGGNGSPKPGKGGKPSPGDMMKDIITGQQQMGKRMQQMQGKDGQKPGQQPGKGQSQGGQNGGEYGNAEELARLAQEQAALRRQIQELNSLLNSRGMGGNAQLMKEIQEKMDRVETDLVNRRTSGQLLERQREIMTRLLEADKAIREQEEDNKRNANAGKDEQRPMPPELREYLQSRQAMLDLYKTTPPVLKPYYKKMAEAYLNEVKQGNN